jgi:predicted anti-sigma-YlaC factor YlaD
MSKNTCEKLCEMLSDYLDGELGQNECVLIDEHLKVCPSCDLVYESLRLTVGVCAQGLSSEIPTDVRDRLKVFLKEHCLEK